MKEYMKRFKAILMNSVLYINLFFAFHYIFRNDTISPIIIPIYFLFFIFFCFTFFMKNILKMDGRLHLFWILASALIFNFIFQEYQIKLVLNDYLLIIGPLFILSIILPLFGFKKLSKKYHILFLLVFITLFISVFLTAIYLVNQSYIWLIVLLLYKLIPYSAAYHLSLAYSFSFEKIFFLILFLPFVIVLNIYTRITGTYHFVSIKDLIIENKERESYIVD